MRRWRGSKKSRWPAGHEAVELEGGCFGVTVSAVCRKVGITRQNYYARRKARQRRGVDAEQVVALVMEERQIQPRLGTRKLHFMLEGILVKEGVFLGRDRFLEVLRQKGLLLEGQAGGVSLHDQFPALAAGVHQPDQGSGGEQTQ